MNFYSEDIINEIIDNEKTEDIIEKIDIFKQMVSYRIHLYAFKEIHYKYTNFLLADEQVKIAFYCLDLEFCLFNCPTMLMYRKYKDKKNDELKYYILLICTKRNYRNQGYASKLLDEFVERVKKENKDKNKKIKIILSSVEEAVLFYEAYGFRWTRETLADHPLLMRYEKYEKEKEYFILEFVI
jgi:ribosomal protein S18 acetylase RimI-like enzyme